MHCIKKGKTILQGGQTYGWGGDLENNQVTAYIHLCVSFCVIGSKKTIIKLLLYIW